MISAFILFLIDNPLFAVLALIIFAVIAWKMTAYLFRKDRPKDAEAKQIDQHIHELISDIFGNELTESIPELVAVLKNRKRHGQEAFKGLQRDVPGLYANSTTLSKKLPNGKSLDSIFNADELLLGHIKSNAKMLANAILDRDIAKEDASGIRTKYNSMVENHKTEMADVNTRLQNMTSERDEYRTVAKNAEKQIREGYVAQNNIAQEAQDTFKKLNTIKSVSSVKSPKIEALVANAHLEGIREGQELSRKQTEAQKAPEFNFHNGKPQNGGRPPKEQNAA